jgi:glycosyltransferase involved in cell wall biosynthesis
MWNPSAFHSIKMKARAVITIVSDILLLVICVVSFLFNFLSYRRLTGRKKRSSTTPTTSNGTCKLEKVSIIIAIRNEARYIGKTLQNLESTTVDKASVQIVLVDCGCKDNSIDVAKVMSNYIYWYIYVCDLIPHHQATIGAISLKVIKTPSTQGRGYAFNSGADVADGDVLLFLRADSLLPPGYDETLRRELSSPGVCMTAFKFGFDSSSSCCSSGGAGISPRALSLLSAYHNLVASLCQLPRGSQGLAVTTRYFKTRRFPADVKLLEDVVFVRAVREECLSQEGGAVRLLEQTLRCSTEEASTVGILKHTFIHLLAFAMRNYFDISDDIIYKWCFVRIPKCLESIRI